MLEFLAFFACCSFIWNYSIPKRYMRYEKGHRIIGRRTVRLQFLRLARRAGLKTARVVTLCTIFLAWLGLSFYFFAVSIYFSSIGLKTVAMLGAVLASVTFWQDIDHIQRNFTEWCYNQEDNVILLAKGCWELVLAGLVFINIFFYI